MTSDRRLLAGVFAFAVIVAACGGSGSKTAAPTNDGGGGGNATEQPTDNGGNGGNGGGNATDNPAAATDLENMLPLEAGGAKFDRSSFDGATLGLAGAAVSQGSLDPFLKANGKTINDVSYAIAAATGDSAGATTIFAWRIKGVDGNKTLKDFLKIDTTSMTQASFGGKTVWKAGDSTFVMAYYVKDDIVFQLTSTDVKVAEAVVQKLP